MGSWPLGFLHCGVAWLSSVRSPTSSSSPRARARHRFDWNRHARTGVPVTLATLGVTAAWFVLQH